MTITLKLTGDPATGPYKVEAILSQPAPVDFLLDGVAGVFWHEGVAPYSLFGDDGPGKLKAGTLGNGPHTIIARVGTVESAPLVFHEGPPPAPKTIEDRVGALETWARPQGFPG